MSLLFKFIIHFYREHQLIIILSKAKKNTSISILFRQFDTVVNQKCKFLNESYSRSLKCKGEGINPARPTIWLHMLCRQYTVWKKLLRSSFNFLNVVFTSLYLIKPTFYIIKKKYFCIANIFASQEKLLPSAKHVLSSYGSAGDSFSLIFYTPWSY